MKITKNDIPFDAALEFAAILYTEYIYAVGGVTFNGDPLPSWEEFRSDTSKNKQSDAWVEAAKSGLSHISNELLDL